MIHSQRTKPVIGVLLAAVLAFAAACGSEDSDDKSSAEDSSASQEADGQSPDVSGIPDVVAEVNGDEVSKDDFVATYKLAYQQAAQQSQMTGQEPDEDAIKEQTANDLVDTLLLTQEAANRDIAATDKQVDTRLAKLAKQNQMGSVDKFLAALEEQGNTEDFVRDQVGIQIVVERLVKDESGSIKPTDAELHKLYDKAVKQAKASQEQSGQKQKIPSFEKAKSQLTEQAKTNKQGKVARALVKSLRKDAEIKVNL